MNTIERITKLMEQKGITKYQLHKLTGIGRSTIYSIFDPKTNIENVKLDHIRAIANALETTMDFFVYGEKTENQEARKFNTITIQTELNDRVVYNLSLDKIQALIAIIQTMEKEQ